MYKLKELPYEYDALELFIDTHTLGLHHRKHQENYLNKLNALLIDSGYDFRYTIEELDKHIKEFPKSRQDDIEFNLGGVLNHNIYFQSMNASQTKPNVILNKLIIKYFKSLDKFKEEFKKSALAIKGSGYTFLVMNDAGELEIVNFLNQDSPLFHGLIPLVCIDVWEHAYYLNYENKRDLYIDNFFNIMDFSYANGKILEKNFY